MQRVFDFAQSKEAAGYIDQRIIDYINECQSESFESHETFDLLAFDFYDIRTDKSQSSKILIYIDKKQHSRGAWKSQI